MNFLFLAPQLVQSLVLSENLLGPELKSLGRQMHR